MNERDIDRLIAAARALADRLEAEGDRDGAAVVRKLCNSRVSSQETNRRLWRDNQQLRREGGGET
jgi:hypothetical protein